MKVRFMKRTRIKSVIILIILAAFVIYLKFLHDNQANKIIYPQDIQVFEDKIRIYESRIIPNLGNNGEPAFLDGDDKEKGDNAVKLVALNTVLSDRMPLNRSLQDNRHKKCKDFTYNPTLKASVILIFYNEILSVILRTVWSVILKSPSHLLKEIILVDDSSTAEDVKGILEHYINTRLSKYDVKLIRLKHRMGLIRARLQGARIATGNVMVFLDAHCEANEGWLEPLLARIEQERTAVLVPIIDVIEANTLAYATNGDSFEVGGFSWSGHFTWIKIQDEAKEHLAVKSPTMAGGYHAQESVTSFGRFHPTFGRYGSITARLAHVWMDDYKRLFFLYQPALEHNPVIGDLTHRKQLRNKLHCKSFKWYLDNVYPEKFIPDENYFAYGQIRNKYNMCLDDLQLSDGKVGPLGLYPCHNFMAMSQLFTLSSKGELRKEAFCSEATSNLNVQLTECHSHHREQYWLYFSRNKTLYNPSIRKCLSSEGVKDSKGLILDFCKIIDHQQWKFTKVNYTAFRET
ncbi:n-acetylgalactosaminyltransferase [Holotrichia oblita]|uniref:N-acetylgalactosaminyltransferase n=1 Tax=Holotrichia oblita TaxID=644536 RepID=A0ACB9SJ28_HOLOL|nr:n-acetylgalactosaminyltransferase [Holotrichia oblita]